MALKGIVRLEELQVYKVQVVTPTGKELGLGAYGKVFEVEHSGTLYAAKQIHSVLLDGVNLEAATALRDMFVQECYSLSKCRHPNIVQFIGVYYPPHQRLALPTLIMEEMDGSLTKFVEKNSPISLLKALSILHHVSLGVWYLHSCDPLLMHRDLSPNNILVNATSLVAKLCDFGIIKVSSPYSRDRDDLTKAPGTPDFMPPEALSQRPVYGLPLDVFSFGGVALYVACGEWPSPSVPAMMHPNTVTLSEAERRRKYLDKIRGNGAVLRILIEECLSDDPDMRPTMEHVSTRIKDEINKLHPDIKVILYLMICTCMCMAEVVYKCYNFFYVSS